VDLRPLRDGASDRRAAGLPRFIPLAWASFGGHVIFGIVVGAVVKWREETA